MGAFDIYKNRELYKNAAYPELPPDYGVHERGFTPNPLPIDLWYEKPYFGRYDLNGVPIYLLQNKIKQLSIKDTEQTIFAVDFVADAFTDLQRHFSAALAQRKINEDFPLSVLPVSQAYIDPENLYQNYINNLFQVFVLSYLEPLKLHCTINNFSDFLRHLRDYFRGAGLGNPLTFSSFIGSKRCPANICGLFIDMQPNGFSEDGKKFKDFLAKKDFSFFISSAKNHGFMVDKNVPWRLVADISSPKMQEYMKKYKTQLNKDSLFKEYYAKAYFADIEMMMNNIVSFYNNYISSRPYNNKAVQIFTRGDVGTTKEVRITKARNRKRSKVGLREIFQTYGINDVLDFYFTIRTYETGANFTDFSKNSIILEAVERKKTLGIAYALSFLNNKITEQVKINLTIGTEYVKGNNDKATQLLNARQPKDNEPSIKDVISGDYSRK